MRKPRPNGCGYGGSDGWTCVGIGELGDAYAKARMVCDSVFGRTDGFEPDWSEPPYSDVPEGRRWNWIDNYFNVPVRIAGMVMTVDRLLDMGSGGPAAPEVECRTDTDPFSDEGFVDALGVYNSAGVFPDAAAFCDAGSSSQEEPVWDMSSAYVDVASSAICFVEETASSSSECELRPQVLEPMQDVWFDPVGLEFNTAVDAALDGVMLSIGLLTKWRELVDSRINGILASLGHIWSLRALLANIHATSPCNQFMIVYEEGKTMTWGSGSPTGRYTARGGTATINGTSVSVPSYDLPGRGSLVLLGPSDFSVAAAFTPRSPDSSTGQFATIDGKLILNQSGLDFTLGVGHMTVITGGNSPRYRIQVVTQERCSISADIVRTSKGGVLKRDADGISPYSILETAECDTADDSGGEESSGDSGAGQ